MLGEVEKRAAPRRILPQERSPSSAGGVDKQEVSESILKRVDEKNRCSLPGVYRLASHLLEIFVLYYSLDYI